MKTSCQLNTFPGIKVTISISERNKTSLCVNFTRSSPTPRHPNQGYEMRARTGNGWVAPFTCGSGCQENWSHFQYDLAQWENFFFFLLNWIIHKLIWLSFVVLLSSFQQHCFSSSCFCTKTNLSWILHNSVRILQCRTLMCFALIWTRPVCTYLTVTTANNSCCITRIFTTALVLKSVPQ